MHSSVRGASPNLSCPMILGDPPKYPKGGTGLEVGCGCAVFHASAPCHHAWPLRGSKGLWQSRAASQGGSSICALQVVAERDTPPTLAAFSPLLTPAPVNATYARARAIAAFPYIVQSIVYCICFLVSAGVTEGGGGACLDAKKGRRGARSAPGGPESGDAENHRQRNTTTTTAARVGGSIRISVPNWQVDRPWISATSLTCRHSAARAMHETARHPAGSNGRGQE